MSTISREPDVDLSHLATVDDEFPARLRRERTGKGLSQRDLSMPGVSYAYISRLEAGARKPSQKVLRGLSRKLGVSVSYLATGQRSEIELGHNEAMLLARFNGLSNQEFRALMAVLDAMRADDTPSKPEQVAESMIDEVQALEELLEQARTARQARLDLRAGLLGAIDEYADAREAYEAAKENLAMALAAHRRDSMAASDA